MRSFDPTSRKAVCVVWVALMVTAWAGGVAVAQPASGTRGAEPDAKLTELWNNLLHYILVRRPDVAEAQAKALLASNPDPRSVYLLSVRTKNSETTLATGAGMPRLKDLIEQVAAVISKGALAVRQDQGEISRWIKLLAGTPRQFLMGQERLVESGEYAVPQLVETLGSPQTPEDLRERITTVLSALGKGAVRPLSEALQSRDPYTREVVARTLGKIGYPHAAAYLKELATRKGVLDRTRQVAEAALVNCVGRAALAQSVAELFYGTALKYYDRADSVMPDSRYETANVWYWLDGDGLTYKVVPRAIFNEIYAMRTARKALAHDEAFGPAVPLWIAADLRKEANLASLNAERTTAGEPQVADPTRDADEPDAAYYAKAAGARYLQAVLARALKDRDLPVAIGAIKALRETCTSENLVKALDEQGGAQPLVSAMSAPQREARYMAAETLALARPQRRFTGYPLVTSVLIEALRQTGARTVVLADPDLDRRNKVKDLLRGAGCKVMDSETFGVALEQARVAGGADVAVVATDITAPGVRTAVSLLRSQAVFSRLGVILVSPPGDLMTARAIEKEDPLVLVLGVDKLTPDDMKKALDQVGDTALPDEASAEWAIRAANALKLLAETKTPVFDLTAATQSLIAALNDKRDPVRTAAAGALGQFGAAKAQRALADLADDASAAEPVRLAAYAALSESLRLFGNQMTEEQTKAVIDVVTAKGSLPLRSGAAQALGAMNLPAQKIKDLILSAK